MFFFVVVVDLIIMLLVLIFNIYNDGNKDILLLLLLLEKNKFIILIVYHQSIDFWIFHWKIKSWTEEKTDWMKNRLNRWWNFFRIVFFSVHFLWKSEMEKKLIWNNRRVNDWFLWGINFFLIDWLKHRKTKIVWKWKKYFFKKQNIYWWYCRVKTKTQNYQKRLTHKTTKTTKKTKP